MSEGALRAGCVGCRIPWKSLSGQRVSGPGTTILPDARELTLGQRVPGPGIAGLWITARGRILQIGPKFFSENREM